jgi:hypothetical protein
LRPWQNTKTGLFTLEIGLRASATTRWRPRSARRAARQPTDIFLCIVDHFEPANGRVSPAIARARLEEWLVRYPQIASAHRDAEGRHPAHSFFYPWDEFDSWEFAHLAELCAEGWGEIELHLHHHDDTEASLRRTLREALATYRRYGALSQWPDGRTAFGFIHGNWALDNSRCEQGRNFCGVNNELDILREEGCYADFTFPAWRHTAQPRQVNSLYFATDNPTKPKSYDTGAPARAGETTNDGLLLIQGPLVPSLQRAGRGWRFAMDDGDLAAYRRYRPERLDRWVRAGLHVQGRPDRLFIKLHTHGAPDANRRALLDSDLDALFHDAETRYNDGTRYRLHYVTARQMFNIVQATIHESQNSLPALRDFLLPPRINTGISTLTLNPTR